MSTISGEQLGNFIRDLPHALDDGQVKTIHKSLDLAAREFDRARGVRYPGPIRRWFE